MSALLKLTRKCKLLDICEFNNKQHTLCFNILRPFSASTESEPVIDLPEEDDFRVLEIGTKSEDSKDKRKRKKFEPAAPRYLSMNPEQDWTSVWPSAATFKWSAVPFPVRQGYVKKSENKGVPPGKYANAELMKIPNFLHLTPKHVKQHCAALKQFCTPWPAALGTDEECHARFPAEVTSRSYCYSSPTIRHPNARTITLTVQVESLSLDDHALDKLGRLAGSRFDSKTNKLTLHVDRCPTRKQNLDYARYLLTVLVLESKKTEAWELTEKEFEDMEYFDWERSGARRSLQQYMEQCVPEAKQTSSPAQESATPLEMSSDHKKNLEAVELAVRELHDLGEDDESVAKYRNSVEKLAGLPPFQ